MIIFAFLFLLVFAFDPLAFGNAKTAVLIGMLVLVVVLARRALSRSRKLRDGSGPVLAFARPDVPQENGD